MDQILTEVAIHKDRITKNEDLINDSNMMIEGILINLNQEGPLSIIHFKTHSIKQIKDQIRIIISKEIRINKTLIDLIH